ELLAGLVKAAAGVTPADPLQKGTFVGPLATKQSYEDYQRYVALAKKVGAAGDAVKAGGAVLTDGAHAHGYFVRPTVLAELPPEHQLVRDELFVPIVVVETVDSLDEALARAKGDRHLLRPHRGRRHLRQPRGRGDHRRLAGRAAVRRLEGERLDGEEHRRPLHGPLLPARAEPDGVPVSSQAHARAALDALAAQP